MPNLIQSLHCRDIGHLRIIAQLWGVDLVATDKEIIIKELSGKLLDPILIPEIVHSLSSEAQDALLALKQADGKIPWAAFSRRYGEIREAGPGKRDREKYYLDTALPTEVLFYRGFLAKAFFDLPAGAQEFAYIPDDLIPLINSGKLKEKRIQSTSSSMGGSNLLGRPASQSERGHPLAICDRLIDDATTIMASLRSGLTIPKTPIPTRVVLELLSTAQIFVGETMQVEPVRLFLKASRREALELMISHWRQSKTFNELQQVPGLIFDVELNNQPFIARTFLLNLLEVIPKDKWWSLQAFILAIKEKFPDFLRPAGDYDSWFIKRESDGMYLRGASHWDEVDGTYIRYMITGPLFWLDMVELATPVGNNSVSAFRFVNNKQRTQKAETAKLHVSSRGIIIAPRLLSRSVRYQIARFCDWGSEREDDYLYYVTIRSLHNAIEQGLKVNQLLSLLSKNGATEIPPAFIKALKRWEHEGTEARIEVQTVLKVSKPEMLEELRKSKAGRFLGETLGPVTITVIPGAQSKVLAALAELGLLAEDLTKMDNMV